MSLAIKGARVASQGGVPAGRMVTSGDPGLFGGLVGAVKGFVTGGPLGAVSGAVSGFRGPQRPAAPTNIALPAIGARTGITVNRPGFVGAAQRAVPGGATGTMQIACPSGYHPNKTGYFLKSGQYVAPGTRCVKNRRRNPLNPRALSRAMGRLTSAKKASKAISRISIRSKK